jgi:hypothetical protein
VDITESDSNIAMRTGMNERLLNPVSNARAAGGASAAAQLTP